MWIEEESRSHIEVWLPFWTKDCTGAKYVIWRHDKSADLLSQQLAAHVWCQTSCEHDRLTCYRVPKIFNRSELQMTRRSSTMQLLQIWFGWVRYCHLTVLNKFGPKNGRPVPECRRLSIYGQSWFPAGQNISFEVWAVTYGHHMPCKESAVFHARLRLSCLAALWSWQTVRGTTPIHSQLKTCTMLWGKHCPVVLDMSSEPGIIKDDLIHLLWGVYVEYILKILYFLLTTFFLCLFSSRFNSNLNPTSNAFSPL